MTIRSRAWYRSNTYAHGEFRPERLLAARERSVSVCLPARNEARTIGPILEQLLPLRERGVVDQIVVVDHSNDGTDEIARALGAEVHDQEQLMPELGPVLGKGDAMWRALSVLTGEVICFLDADSERFGAHFACGVLGPVLCRPGIAFVKGFYRRPFRVGHTTVPDGGGRVTELTARPLLNLFFPDLAAIQQPLAGEIAARRDLLERLPFTTGYGVDIGLLIDAYSLAGLDAIAQVDLDVRQNAHQPLRDLGPMAFAVLQAVAVRLEREGRLRGPLPLTFSATGADASHIAVAEPVERPPLASLRAAA
ncbi:MAG: glucosyl-3-phosphoglycerate synthase [Solirubrobacterales bacterium]|nr:glucosyl-3-phosphoglycerate synthase [Solirubrobacterales bacterium]MBV9810807.1 glucosyl-3-phosphoglycerate synthase [Solirubrobacterales bacterium]